MKIYRHDIKNYLEILIFVVVLLVVAYFWYQNSQTEKVKTQKQQAKEEQEDKKMEVSNKKYLRYLLPTCEKPVKDITAIDFYRCRDMISNMDIYITFASRFIDAKEALSDPDLPKYCGKKIDELDSYELNDCLYEPPDKSEESVP